MSLIVMTFGAAALQGSDSLLTIGEALRQSQQTGHTVIAVVGALPGVTELLQQSIDLGNFDRAYNKLNSIHSNMARKLIREARDRALLIQDIEDILGSYQWLGRSIINRSATPVEAATMLAIGERLSAHLLAAWLRNNGIQSSTLNGHDLLVTDDDSLAATPDMERSRQQCVDHLTPLVDSGALIVVGGTGGHTADNRPTRLAGDGLHLTASTLAAFCQASGLWLMGQHDGILSADPDYVSNGQTIPVLPVHTLTDMAAFGDSMPTATALKAVIEAHVPIFIRSVFQPAHPGTYIQPYPNLEMADIGPIVVQKLTGTIHASGLEPEAGIKALSEDHIPAVISDNGQTFFVAEAHLNSADRTLSQAFPAASLHIQREPKALITVVGIDKTILNDLQNAIQPLLDNIGIESPVIITTTGHRDRAHLSTLVPTESIAPVVNEIHNLTLKQSK